MKGQVEKVILDTNIISIMFGLFKAMDKHQPLESHQNHRMYQKFFDLVEEGRLKLYITPQILKEFLFCRGQKPEAVDRFDRFMKKYINIIQFRREERQKAKQITYELGNTYFKIGKSKNSQTHMVIFEKAQTPKDRNYADALIMAEAMISGMDVLTNNLKDFINFDLVNKLNKKYDLPGQYSVYKPNRYMKYKFPEFSHLAPEVKYKKSYNFDNGQEI